jgi:hypothetical protein
VAFDLQIDPTAYGRYSFTVGGGEKESVVTWSQSQVRTQVGGPLESTGGMPGGPFTCEELATSGSCAAAAGQCCTTCKSADSLCVEKSVEIARAGVGTTGEVKVGTYCMNYSGNYCGPFRGCSTDSSGVCASVYYLFHNNNTVIKVGSATGSATTSANGFSAGEGGTPGVASVVSDQEAGHCEQHAPERPGHPGLLVLTFV